MLRVQLRSTLGYAACLLRETSVQEQGSAKQEQKEGGSQEMDEPGKQKEGDVTRCDVTCVMLQGHFLSGEVILTVERREGGGVFFKISSSSCKAPDAYTASHPFRELPVV